MRGEGSPGLPGRPDTSARPLPLSPQDLELWMTRRPVPGGFNLVARAGRDVQEIRVTTGLSVDAMRAAIQRVLARLG